MSSMDMVSTRSDRIREVFGRIISYVVFVSWITVTVVPLVWMLYSSFKSNEELVMNIYSLPHDLIDNKDDLYKVIPRTLNVIPDYDEKTDPRERVILESTTIAPGLRLMVHFLVKEDLPADLQQLQPGDLITVKELPRSMQRKIQRKTVWFNYRSAFSRGKLGWKFVNSIIYSLSSTFLLVFFGLMIGFATSKMPFPRLSKFLMGLIGLGYLLSINSVIIPLYLMLSRIGLTDTHLGIILVYTAFGLPLSVMLSSQFMKGLPNSLLESAFMDGASTFRTFVSIVLPLTRPVIVTISIISALAIWNEFLLVLILASSDFTKSLPVGVFSFSSLTSTQLGWQLAALVIAVLPVMVVYFAFTKKLTGGVLGGAVKG